MDCATACRLGLVAACNGGVSGGWEVGRDALKRMREIIWEVRHHCEAVTPRMCEVKD